MAGSSAAELTIAQVARVAAGDAPPPITPQDLVRMEAARALVDQALAGGAALYGINTGFGPLASVRIPPERAAELSRRVVLACCTGVGEPLPIEVVRAMMLVRLAGLLRGRSGVRPVIARTLRAMLERGVTPLVPSQGSVGASGDLAPLAHVAAVLTCEPDGGGYAGRAWFGGELLDGVEAMARAGIERVAPQAKEGLALTNGTGFMLACAALAVHRARLLWSQGLYAAALSHQALLGLTGPFHPALQAAARQPGQAEAARVMRLLLAGSALAGSAPERVQDAYSLRCLPQVMGPAWDMLCFVAGRVEDALNGDSDNPLVFPELEGGPAEKVLSGGNFHGQGPALWLGSLSLALAEVGSMAERRIYRLLDPALSGGLPAMLTPQAGLDTGLMVAQYTAAALVSDNKALCFPDGADSIPTAAGQEDHVSMGANAARRALALLDNTARIVAIELICACQALELRPDGPARLSPAGAAAFAAVRTVSTFRDRDRQLSEEIEALASLLLDGGLERALLGSCPELASQG